MKLSDVVSNAGLAGYAEIALILFIVAFVAIVIRTLWPSRRAEFEEARRLPLEDEPEGEDPQS